MVRRLLLCVLVLAALAEPAGAAVRIFPSDELTVRDGRQLTGRRVDLPLPDCAARPSECAELRRLNRLDGFDVLPRVSVRFERAIDVDAVRRATLSVRPAAGGRATGLERLVWDPATRTLTGTPARQLQPGTRHVIRVARRLGGRAARATFTTMSAAATLRRLARRVRAARPRLRVDAAVPAGTPLRRLVDRGGAAPAEEAVPDLAAAGAARYVFGTLTAPSWLDGRRTIADAPTRRTPPRRGTARMPFVLVVPAGTPPRGGFPVAIFGHGFLRSRFDLFLAARLNAARGMATIAIDAAGHGGGPRSAVVAGATVVPAPGRSVDADGDGTFSDLEGLRAAPQPAPDASLLLRDSLRQTALDNVALAAALRAGAPGLRALSRTRIAYVGQSLGGIYGTMAAALEPRLDRAVLNVPGGPIVEVVRLSPSFRPLLEAELAARRPALATAGTPLAEQLPLRGEAPVTAPSPAALAAQAALARIAWLTRSGSPEAYAPLLRPRRTLVQVAYGDRTVPNPTNDIVVRAGDLKPRTWVFRNDRTPAPATNPHGFLLDPALPGLAQAVAFLRRGAVTDPDGSAAVFEPLRGDLLAALNF